MESFSTITELFQEPWCLWIPNFCWNHHIGTCVHCQCGRHLSHHLLKIKNRGKHFKPHLVVRNQVSCSWYLTWVSEPGLDEHRQIITEMHIDMTSRTNRGSPLAPSLGLPSGAQHIIVYIQSQTKTNPFYSFSTRESLASNTSSIVESNRRQNPALSPAHGGAGPTFNFRASTDPPTSEAEKLQKPSNCLQASVTSVWLSFCLRSSVSSDTATFTTIGPDVYISAKTNISSTGWGLLELCC